MIRISGGKYVALIKELIRIIQGSYKPDHYWYCYWRFICRYYCSSVKCSVWHLDGQGYKDRSRGVGKRSRIVRFADEISFIDPRNKKT